MALYGLSRYSQGGTTAAALGGTVLDIKASPTGNVAVTEISLVYLDIVTNQVLTLGRATTELFQMDAVPFIPEEDIGSVSETKMATTWSVLPVMPTIALRRAHFNSPAGCGVIWSFPRGLTIPPSASVVLCNQSGNSIWKINFSAEIDE